MSLLDLLKKGSTLTEYDGENPTKMDLSSQEGKILKDSQLDLNTTNPKNMDLSSKYETDLLLSQLDLSENPPKKYLDNPPR